MSFLPLSALLSHALVAFTIEFDNEAEHRMPHWTTNYGASAGWTAELQRDMAWGPWLTSMVMWTNCMQFVGEDGITVRELERLARTHTNLNGMERWGYVVVEPDPEDKRAKPPRSAWVIRAKPSGRKAREIWQPLFGVIETRWRERFGKQRIEALRESLCAVIGNMDLNLPDCLPILGYGLYSNVEQKKWERHDGQEIESVSGLSLPALLSKVLLAFAVEFERESPLALAISANVLRLFAAEGAEADRTEAIRVRDLPRLAGVSKEAIAFTVSFLTKRGFAVVEAEAADSRTKVLKLTRKGQLARDQYHALVKAVEERWRSRFGADTIARLRETLEELAGSGDAKSPLFQGLDPHPDNWRAKIKRAETLPHYPMVLHRGGYPDGS